MKRVSMVLDCCGVSHESLTKTASLIPTIESKFKDRTDQSCYDARLEMSGFTSTDTRLSGKKNRSQSTTSWIDLITRKILAYSNVIRDGRHKAYSNFDGPSKMMESRGLQSCLENLQDDGTLNNIATVTRDMDNKSWKILEEFGFDKQSERFDPGHYWKKFSQISIKILNMLKMETNI